MNLVLLTTTTIKHPNIQTTNLLTYESKSLSNANGRYVVDGVVVGPGGGGAAAAAGDGVGGVVVAIAVGVGVDVVVVVVAAVVVVALVDIASSKCD